MTAHLPVWHIESFMRSEGRHMHIAPNEAKYRRIWLVIYHLGVYHKEPRQTGTWAVQKNTVTDAQIKSCDEEAGYGFSQMMVLLSRYQPRQSRISGECRFPGRCATRLPKPHISDMSLDE